MHLYAAAYGRHKEQVQHARRKLTLLRHRIKALQRECRAVVGELEALEREELPYVEALAMTG